MYRLCGSATKKRILREAFERNARSVNLSPDNVPDINVITGNVCIKHLKFGNKRDVNSVKTTLFSGVLKDYLRELPEPLFTKCLYQMMVDALAVCLPDDPQGNAKLMFSILDCLPKVNRVRIYAWFTFKYALITTEKIDITRFLSVEIINFSNNLIMRIIDWQ